MEYFSHVDNIQISDNRQRKEFRPEALADLMDSIQSKGLFHPIVVRSQGENKPFVLVAGECRLRAIKDIWALGGSFKHNGRDVAEEFVPIVLLSDLSPLEVEEAELEENTRRTDLTWQERAQATARLAKLRAAQAEAAGLPPPTTADISEEVRGRRDADPAAITRKEIILANHLDDPDIAKATSPTEAFKILRRKDDAKRNVQLAEQVGKTFSASQHKVLLGDALELMTNLPIESFDVILTDPPYGIDAQDFNDSGGLAAGGHAYDDSYAAWVDLMNSFCVKAFQVAKPQAHAYLFCDVDNFGQLKVLMRAAGWTVFRTPLIWHKPNGMRAPWPENGPQRKYEMILFAMKGKRPVSKLYPDVLSYTADENLGHAAQKPVALFVDLLKRSTRPGDTILDAFCGSGTIFPAASEVLCTATGIELDANHYGIAVKRIGELK